MKEWTLLTEIANVLAYALSEHPILFILWELLIKAFWILLLVYVVLRICGVGKKKKPRKITKEEIRYCQDDCNTVTDIILELNRGEEVERIMRGE